MTALFNLSGKTALITGSSGGMGLAMARGLTEAGARVILNGRDSARLDAVATEFPPTASVLTSVFDVADELSVAEAFVRLDEAGIAVDIVINNAGIQFRKPMVDLDLADWQRVLDTNLTGAFLVGREAARRMIARRSGGKIINIGSLTSQAARATVSPYAAAKGGLLMLTRTMAAEWAQFDIQANAIGPGYIETEMNRALLDNVQFDSWVRSRTPAARWGQPDELVGTAVYLASRASAYVNGQIIYVDGGMLAVL